VGRGGVSGARPHVCALLGVACRHQTALPKKALGREEAFNRGGFQGREHLLFCKGGEERQLSARDKAKRAHATAGRKQSSPLIKGEEERFPSVLITFWKGGEKNLLVLWAGVDNSLRKGAKDWFVAKREPGLASHGGWGSGNWGRIAKEREKKRGGKEREEGREKKKNSNRCERLVELKQRPSAEKKKRRKIAEGREEMPHRALSKKKEKNRPNGRRKQKIRRPEILQLDSEEGKKQKDIPRESVTPGGEEKETTTTES